MAISVRRWAVGAIALLAAAAIVIGAGPASAHAILLRTDPAPQTTTARPPSAIHLYFSESVEVTFGAIRVFDVDGHRVDRGAVTRTGANREVVVPTPALKEGSYTVTWRAVSSDGHPVHGGFTFYAVHPSTISPVAIAADTGAGRTVGWGFGIDRFLWFAAFLALGGITVVRRWVWGPAVASTGLSESGAAKEFKRISGRALVGAWMVLVVSGAAALIFQAASVSGLAFGDAIGVSVLRQVLSTAFGHLWLIQLATSLAIGLPVVGLTRRQRTLGVPPGVWLGLLAAGLAGLAFTTALNGHARTLGHEAVGVPALAVHLLAVSVWVGGLGALLLLGGFATRGLERADRTSLAAAAIPRFSRVATWGVAIVIATGTLNAVIGLESVSDLWKVTYGRVILAKIVALLVALALAARHLLVTPRRLADERGDAATTSFGRTAAVELGALVVAVALASGLVALIPGRSIALQAGGSVAQEHRAGGYTIQIFIDPGAAGANDIHVTFVNPQGLGAAEVATATATLGSSGSPSRALSLRLLSPGHFVATADVAAGRRVVIVSASAGGTRIRSTFRLTIHAKG